MNTKRTQLKHVLDHLESGETLTAVKADCIYGIKSLSSRISELRKDGHLIDSIPIGGGHVKYELDDNAPFEREFFEFLKGYGGLELYIDGRSKCLGDGVEFTLPSETDEYVTGAFNWDGELYEYWGYVNRLWLCELNILQIQNSLPTLNQAN